MCRLIGQVIAAQVPRAHVVDLGKEENSSSVSC